MIAPTTPETASTIPGCVQQRPRMNAAADDDDEVDDEDDQQDGGNEAAHEHACVLALGVLPFEELRAHGRPNPLK